MEEYLKNPDRKVVTKDGRKARIVCTDRNSIYPIVALVNRGGGEDIYTYDERGVYAGNWNELCLFFAPEKHEGWMNIYKAANGPVGGWVYGSKEEAERNIGLNQDRITVCKVEWEE